MLHKIPSKSGWNLLDRVQAEKTTPPILSERASKGRHLHTEADVLPEHK